MSKLYYFYLDNASHNPWKIWKNDELFFFDRYTNDLVQSRNPLDALKLIAIYD